MLKEVEQKSFYAVDPDAAVLPVFELKKS